MAIWVSDHKYRIKKKADVETFLQKVLVKGCSYYVTDVDGDFDYCIDKDKDGEVILLMRAKRYRGDIFSPYFQVIDVNVAKFIWNNRKLINKMFFSGR